MVQAAGLAIKALTTSPSTATEEESPEVTIDYQKAAFSASTANYFRLLDSVGARLRRQIYALEEADIIPTDSPTKDIGSVNARSGAAGLGTAQAQTGVEKANSAVMGGLGNLDLAWLNSRSDTVGRDMEAQIWAQTRSFLEEFERQRTSQSSNGEEGMVAAEGDIMDIDTREG